MSQPLPAGKLPSDLLARLLTQLGRPDNRVLLGPGIGRDATVLDMGDHYLVAKSDPITFASDNIGWYAVHVNANDIACLGARPLWFLVTALLPAGRADAEMAEDIFKQITDACTTLGITLVGGHTEITLGLDRPILSGAMLGEVSKDKLVTVEGARLGDIICLTKAIPIEATALVAREKGEALHRSDDLVSRARRLLQDPGISVVREALLAADAGLATAMHDPTEGGLVTGLVELATAAQAGLDVNADAIPILPEGAELCDAFGLDPLGAMASGALLITVRPESASSLVQLLSNNGIPCTQIGRLTPWADGMTMTRAGRRQPLPRFAVDEVARLFGS